MHASVRTHTRPVVSEHTRVQSTWKVSHTRNNSQVRRWNEVHEDRFLACGDRVWLYVHYKQIFLHTIRPVLCSILILCDVICLWSKLNQLWAHVLVIKLLSFTLKIPKSDTLTLLTFLKWCNRWGKIWHEEGTVELLSRSFPQTQTNFSKSFWVFSWEGKEFLSPPGGLFISPPHPSSPHRNMSGVIGEVRHRYSN